MAKTAKMQIENVLQPGKTYSADPAKYEAMKKAVLAVLPKTSPGLTVADPCRITVEPLSVGRR